jgi:hypothetical protein
MKASRLFITTAVIEGATGLALLIAPGVVVALLIGGGVDAPGAMVVARVAAIAMLSISIACWIARGEEQGGTSRGLVLALLFYNSAVALLLMHASIGLHLSAIGLWPAVGGHAVLAGWCIAGLRASAATLR